MSDYFARVDWQRADDEAYVDNQYSRGHRWEFDGGVSVPASSSPHIVPLPYSVEENVDPEEAFVAALASCHMLFFLSIAAKRRYVIDRYIDDAVGAMAKNAEGNMAITQVTLRPRVTFSGDRQPTTSEIEKMHYQSHASCFLANSVKSAVVIEPQ